MENGFKSMSVSELEAYLQRTREKLENAEDELDIVLERSNSGQHVSSKYIQSNRERIEQEIESLNDTIQKILVEIESRKK